MPRSTIDEPAPATPTAAESAYPPHNVAPITETLSACEVLCWIGYQRPIPQKLYYAPPGMPPFDGDVEAYGTRLHEAIPHPRPEAEPMTAAEKTLIQSLKGGRLTAWTEKPNRKLQPEDFLGAVVVSTRGDLCPDNAASIEDQNRAWELKRYQNIFFYTGDVLSLWPPKPIAGEQIIQQTKNEVSPEGTASFLPKPRGRPPTKRQLTTKRMVADYQGSPEALNAEIEKTLESKYGVGRDTCRKARKQALAILLQQLVPTISTIADN